MARVADDQDGRDALDSSRLVETLRGLIAIPSVNPGTSERAIALRVVAHLRQVGIAPMVLESMPGRPSVVAVIDGESPGPRIVLNAHLDTVPVGDASDWSTDPFGGLLQDNFVYGRGACDDKAGMAIILALAEMFWSRRDLMAGSLVCHFAAGEERAEPGTLSLIEAGYGGDFGIVLEATDMAVASCARGLVYFVVRLRGRAAHASNPSEGRNPLSVLGRALAAVDDLNAKLNETSHPLLPAASCTPTIIRSGLSENTIPESCEVTVDRRLLPGETIDSARVELQTQLERALRGSDISFDIGTLPMYYAACETNPESEVLRHVVTELSSALGTPVQMTGTPYSSDMRVLINDGGMEAITFGPGRVADCHAANERIDARAVAQAGNALAQALSCILGDGSTQALDQPAGDQTRSEYPSR